MKRKSILTIAIAVLVLLSTVVSGQIIADHYVVNHYEFIPQQYIDSVKKMLLVVPGESHSNAYFEGLLSLASTDTAYKAQWSSSGAPDSYTDQYLRAGRGTWGDYDNETGWIHNYGEEDWFTNATALARTKAGISYCHDNGITISAIGFGWCYDQISGPNTEGADPVYGVHWAGRSIHGPDGDHAWGIDADDYTVTGNSICMDTYIEATQGYIDYCTDSVIPTQVFFTTGPVDDYSDEDFYQGWLKHEHLRNYVKADTSRILFDYADILCFDEDGTGTTTTWNDSIFPSITPTNVMPLATGHISDAGSVRLAKAMWWMLAKMAGWDGTILVSEIQIVSDGGSTETMTGDSLQLSGVVAPSVATNHALLWSVINGTGSATITTEGLLIGGLPGQVDVVAMAMDGSRVGDTLALTITEPAVPVTSITVTAAGGVTEIVVGNTLQYSATVLPVDASNLSVAWSVVNGTGSASISLEGLLTGGLPGRVDVIAMAMDGTGMGDTLALTIAAPEVPVTGITVTAAGGVTAVDEGNTLQFSAAVMPVDASYPVVAWSVVNSTGSASITSGGLVTALTTGTVDVVATAADGSGVSDSFSLTIVASTVPVSNISIVSAGGVSVVDEGNTLQFTASVLPSNATNQAVLWSVNHGTGTADISQNGLLTAGTEGTVDVLASAQDGSGIGSFFALSIQGPDGLSEESKSSTIVLYPNPSPGKFYLDAGDLSIVKIEVVSAAGSVVLELFPEPGERVIELDLSDQKPGAFFIHTLSKEQSSVHRVIISR